MSTEKKPRGFQTMTPEQRQRIASQGGKAAHATGRAHQFDSEEAAEAGRKGGMTVSRDREHMAKIGARGGSRRRRKQTAERTGERKPDPFNTHAGKFA